MSMQTDKSKLGSSLSTSKDVLSSISQRSGWKLFKNVNSDCFIEYRPCLHRLHQWEWLQAHLSTVLGFSVMQTLEE